METMPASTVPLLSMLSMALSILISFGLPLFLFFFFRKRLGMKGVAMLTGMASYVVFALILERLVFMVFFSSDADAMPVILQSLPGYMVYAAFTAGIYETGRLICLLILKKKEHTRTGTGLAFGIGYGGIEAMLYLGIATISNFDLSLRINAGGAGIPPEAASQVAVLVAAEPAMFLLGGLERVLAICAQISISLFVWAAVNRKGKWFWYPLAILVHTAILLPTVMVLFGRITGPLAMGAEALFEVILAVAAVKLYKRILAEDNAQPGLEAMASTPVLQGAAYDNELGEKDA